MASVVSRDQNQGLYAEVAELVVTQKLSAQEPLLSLAEYCGSLLGTEKWLVSRLDGASQGKPLREQWLNGIRGIGPVLSSGLIAGLSPVSRWKSISAVWAYCMLSAVHWESECTEGHRIISSHSLSECPVRLGEGRKPCSKPVPVSQLVNSPIRRKRGWYLLGNTKMRTLLWKVATSFEKQPADRSKYRRLYEARKQAYATKVDPEEKGAKGHIRNMTLRYVEKRFLADTINAWRALEGLPPFEPYAVKVLKHPYDGEELTTDRFGKFVPRPVGPTMLEPEFRYLVDAYYDIQKLRIEAFNRVVAYVKDHYTEHPEWERAVQEARARREKRRKAKEKRTRSETGAGTEVQEPEEP